jgi:hypothetical protein
MSFVQLINDVMNNLVPGSLLAKWSEQRYTPSSFVKVNNWYLPFDGRAETVSELNSTKELQLREKMYAQILKQIGRA